MAELLTDDMVEAAARRLWDARTADHDPRTTWDDAPTMLRYSHEATLRDARVVLEAGAPLVAAHLLQEVEDDVQALDGLAAQCRRTAGAATSPGPAATPATADGTSSQ